MSANDGRKAIHKQLSEPPDINRRSHLELDYLVPWNKTIFLEIRYSRAVKLQNARCPVRLSDDSVGCESVASLQSPLANNHESGCVSAVSSYRYALGSDLLALGLCALSISELNTATHPDLK